MKEIFSGLNGSAMHRSQGWSSNCRFTLHRLVQSMQGRARRSKRLQFFFLVLYWNWNFPAFSCALKFHGNTTGFTQEKRRKHFLFLESTSARSSPVPAFATQSRNEHARPAFFQYFVAAEILPCFCEQALLVLENMVISGRTVRGIDAILAKKKHEQRI